MIVPTADQFLNIFARHDAFLSFNINPIEQGLSKEK